MIKSNLSLLSKIYLAWSTIAISIAFLAGKLSNDNITHLFILGFLLLSLFLFRYFNPKRPKLFFIISCSVLAALGEGAYMISKPVLPSLLTPLNAPLELFIHNYLIDLALTIPVYIFIFSVIWWLINKFNYSRWEYIFLFALGQALGDGSSFFALNPFLLILIPFIMLNYHAMNVAPYLRIEKYLSEKTRSNSLWKYPLAIICVWASYFIGGTAIKVMVKILNIE